VNAEFNWWLLLVGLVIGAGLAWVVLDDRGRGPNASEALTDEEAVDAEASWIAEQLSADGRSVDPDVAAAILRLHAEYADADGWTPATRSATNGDTDDGPERSPEPGRAPMARQRTPGPGSGPSDSREGATRV
jgi:hypothetical protein